MTLLTRRARRLGAALAGLAAACTLAFPAAAANAASGSYSPNPHEWYFSKWGIQQDVWPITEGSGVTIGLVDSGVQASLPDLQGVVEPGSDMLGSSNGEQDHASNGGHGTLMAELIAGQGIGSGQYGTAPVGTAPQAKILPVHVTDPSTTMTPVANGIKYAADHGAGVINLSIGATSPTETSCDPQLQAAVSYALAHNAVVIAAAGDANLGDSRPIEPATCAGVLAVGGVDQTGAAWQDSTPGPEVSVAAPGKNVYVASDTGQQYSVQSSGTSGAAALTSAAAALIRSKYPSMPWYTVDQRLINTTVHVGQVPNNQTGYGIIDISKALQVAKDPVPASAPDPPYARYQAWLKSTGQSAGGQSSNGSSSGGSNLPLILGGVFVILLIGGVMLIVVITRSHSRRGPGGPGGPGGGYSPPNGYAPPAGQYPQAGQGQYPQPGPYAPPGQPQPPQPGQYPPPRQ